MRENQGLSQSIQKSIEGQKPSWKNVLSRKVVEAFGGADKGLSLEELGKMPTLYAVGAELQPGKITETSIVELLTPFKDTLAELMSNKQARLRLLQTKLKGSKTDLPSTDAELWDKASQDIQKQQITVSGEWQNLLASYFYARSLTRYSHLPQ